MRAGQDPDERRENDREREIETRHRQRVRRSGWILDDLEQKLLQIAVHVQCVVRVRCSRFTRSPCPDSLFCIKMFLNAASQASHWVPSTLRATYEE